MEAWRCTNKIWFVLDAIFYLSKFVHLHTTMKRKSGFNS